VYNKLFTKILDSSIWLESCQTRIVWMTMIAVMDETGHCQFAGVGNVAHRARVTLEEAQEALTCLEGADPDSSDPDHGGRRIERVPGGWIVLNAEKHRSLVTRAVKQEQTRERVRRWRQRQKDGGCTVAVETEGTAEVIDTRVEVACNAECNAHVTPSEAVTEAVTESATEAEESAGLVFPTKGGGEWVLTLQKFQEWVALYPAVNVHEEISAMVAWCDANAERRKLARSMPRFCVSWLNKARSNTSGYRGTGVKL
jgi:hypothetical protein